MKSKKAQLAVFIVIGIIIIFFVTVFLTVKEKSEGAKLSPELRIPGLEAPTKFQGLSIFVESCIEKAAVDGLRKLADHGGYIEPADFSIRPSAFPTEGNAIELAKGSNLVIPYWFYLKSENKCEGICEFSQEKPPLYRRDGRKSIESQLDAYINEKMLECIDNFRPLQEQFKVQELEKPKAASAVTETNVVVRVEYPLKASIEDTEAALDNFAVSVPVHLKEIYELASYIADMQAEHKFIEKDVLNLIVGFSSIDKDALPPMAAVDIGYGKSTTWSKSSVGENLRNMVTSYIPLLQVDNTLNAKPHIFPGDPLSEAIFNEGMFIPSEKQYPNTEVSFNYLGFWEPYFDLNCKGDVCRPESIGTNLLPSLFGLQRYNFVYDMSFPIIVAISNPNDLNGQGYSFRFLLEANIRNNEPLGSVFKPLKPTGYVPSSLLCDDDKRSSGDVRISFKDQQGNAVNDVEVMYSCVNDICHMGKSSSGVFASKFPKCIGGIITFIKDKYLSQSIGLNTMSQPRSLNIVMQPIKDMRFTVMKKKLIKAQDGWLFRDEPLFLSPDEEAIVTLERTTGFGEEEYTAVASFSGSEKYSTIAVAPGKYKISIQLFTKQSVTIPADERCEDSFLDEECYTIPEFKMAEGYVAGGLILDHEFTMAEMQKNTIVFYVVNTDFASSPGLKVEDIEQMGKTEEYSKLYANSLMPKIE